MKVVSNDSSMLLMLKRSILDALKIGWVSRSIVRNVWGRGKKRGGCSKWEERRKRWRGGFAEGTFPSSTSTTCSIVFHLRSDNTHVDVRGARLRLDCVFTIMTQYPYKKTRDEESSKSTRSDHRHGNREYMIIIELTVSWNALDETGELRRKRE